MKLFRRTTKKILKHKDQNVLIGDYDPSVHSFRKVSLLNAAHLPIGVRFSGNNVDLESLNSWLIARGIPNYRVDLDRLIKRLEIEDELELLEEENALSVSDNYWLSDQDRNETYEETNFFARSFDMNGFGAAMFRTNRFTPKETARHTPNNTLCGYHRKAWMKREDQLYLYKGSTGFHQQECINEWIASVIAEQLGLYVVPYEVTVYENQLVSVCQNFLSPDLDLVCARDAMRSAGKNQKESYELLVQVMKEHGISDAENSLDELLLLDYLMMNTDRHSQNLGILTDANTNQWIAMAPIFDTGTALGCFVKTSNLEQCEDKKKARFLKQRHFVFEELLEIIGDLSRFDLSVLDGIEQTLADKLFLYRALTGISNERIEALCRLLRRRIDRVKYFQTKQK
ncbi:MAG: HipA domain-containing protein [Solobacterium sp.]|nr:HipA domain-containing protein [Solobacterium sp.]